MTSSFIALVLQELARARAKHENMHSLHEGYAVLLEEVDELWEAIKTQKVDYDHILEELVQVAAMAWRISVDCQLLAS